MRPLVLLLFLTSWWLVSSGEDLSVSKSLTDVWNSFGDFAGSLYTIRISAPHEGRGHKDGNILLPLAIGFKAGGAIMSAMTALKLLVIKTMAFSGLALLASLALTCKYLYDKLQHPHYEAMPYHYPPAPEAWETSYEVQTHTDGQAVQDTPPDLQGHYSSPVYHSANATQTAHGYGTVTPVSQTSQRKYFRASPMYKTTIYKTTYRARDKRY